MFSYLKCPTSTLWSIKIFCISVDETNKAKLIFISISSMITKRSTRLILKSSWNLVIIESFSLFTRNENIIFKKRRSMRDMQTKNVMQIYLAMLVLFFISSSQGSHTRSSFSFECQRHPIHKPL